MRILSKLLAQQTANQAQAWEQAVLQAGRGVFITSSGRLMSTLTDEMALSSGCATELATALKVGLLCNSNSLSALDSF